MKNISLLTTMICEVQSRCLTHMNYIKTNKSKANACNWSIVLDCEMKCKHEIKVSLCLGTQCSLSSTYQHAKASIQVFSEENYLFSFTSIDPTLHLLPLVIVSTFIYMYWLDKWSHNMWCYSTCKHVSLFWNSLYYMYVLCKMYLWWMY